MKILGRVLLICGFLVMSGSLFISLICGVPRNENNLQYIIAAGMMSLMMPGQICIYFAYSNRLENKIKKLKKENDKLKKKI